MPNAMVKAFISSRPQLWNIWHHRQSIPKTAISSECSSQVDHADRSMWTHHSHSKEITLAALFNTGSTSSWTSCCSSHCMGQLRLLVRWMLASSRHQSLTAVIWHIRVCRATDQNTSGWHFIRCRSSTVEHVTSVSAFGRQLCTF